MMQLRKRVYNYPEPGDGAHYDIVERSCCYRACKPNMTPQPSGAEKCEYHPEGISFGQP